MKFRPLHDRVVIKRADTETKTAGGILIPDTAGEKPQEGEVIAVGPGGRDEAGKLIPIDLKKGDKVLFGKWSGTESRSTPKSSSSCKIATSWACSRSRPDPRAFLPFS
jgi:chaperonin GroES